MRFRAATHHTCQKCGFNVFPSKAAPEHTTLTTVNRWPTADRPARSEGSNYSVNVTLPKPVSSLRESEFKRGSRVKLQTRDTLRTLHLFVFAVTTASHFDPSPIQGRNIVIFWGSYNIATLSGRNGT